MSGPKLFLTGATGYIGGDVLAAVAAAHPAWPMTCLVRSETRGAAVAAAYPSVRLVYGDLASAALIEREAAAADIVLHCANADDEASARAIAAGLGQHTEDRPGYWIHTSGTGILCHADIDVSSYGNDATKIWDDVADMPAIRDDIPAHAPHRAVDALVFSAAREHAGLKTAIVCPPCIYGDGRGAANKRSMQIPEMTRASLERKRGFVVSEGRNRWANVHVRDLADVYVKLAEAAAAGGGAASWNADGYYFAQNGEHVWGDISRALATEAHKAGFLETADVDVVSSDEAGKILTGGAMMWGANSRCHATRARDKLGWAPRMEALESTMAAAVRSEADAMGLVVHHAAKAAGDL